MKRILILTALVATAQMYAPTIVVTNYFNMAGTAQIFRGLNIAADAVPEVEFEIASTALVVRAIPMLDLHEYTVRLTTTDNTVHTQQSASGEEIIGFTFAQAPAAIQPLGEQEQGGSFTFINNSQHNVVTVTFQDGTQALVQAMEQIIIPKPLADFPIQYTIAGMIFGEIATITAQAVTQNTSSVINPSATAAQITFYPPDAVDGDIYDLTQLPLTSLLFLPNETLEVPLPAGDYKIIPRNLYTMDHTSHDGDTYTFNGFNAPQAQAAAPAQQAEQPQADQDGQGE